MTDTLAVTLVDAAKGLYAARSKLFTLSTNNAVLQFLLEVSTYHVAFDSKNNMEMTVCGYGCVGVGGWVCGCVGGCVSQDIAKDHILCCVT